MVPHLMTVTIKVTYFGSEVNQVQYLNASMQFSIAAALPILYFLSVFLASIYSFWTILGSFVRLWHSIQPKTNGKKSGTILALI